MTSLTSVRAFDFSARSEIKGKEMELKAELNTSLQDTEALGVTGR